MIKKIQDQLDCINWLKEKKINYAGLQRKAMVVLMQVWEACGSPKAEKKDDSSV